MSQVTYPKDVKQKAAYRELFFDGSGQERENLSLILKDKSVDKQQSGYYKIPLYSSKTVSKAQQDDAADIELVPIIPHALATPFADEVDGITALRSGYLYIYVDGHLWRELAVTHHDKQHYCTFSDVNLAYQKGPQRWRVNKENTIERIATGEKLHHILVPNRLQGQLCNVQIAYSEVQWSWRQIEAFGGMNPQDPRLNYGPVIKPGNNDNQSNQLRRQRMTKLDKLQDFPLTYSHEVLPQHIQIHAPNKEHIHKPIIPDQLGTLRFLAAEVTLSRNYLQSLPLLSMKEDENPAADLSEFKPSAKTRAKLSIASLIHNQFIAYPRAVKRKLAAGITVSDEEVEHANKYLNWAENEIDMRAYCQYLRTDEALELGHYINLCKSLAFELVTEEDNPASFYFCIADYAYYEDLRRNEIYEVASDCLGPMKDLTAQQLATFMVSEGDHTELDKIDAQDLGQELILRVLGTHLVDLEYPDDQLKLHSLIFPKRTGDGLSDYVCHRDTPEAPFDIRFSLALQQRITIEAQEITLNAELAQVGRRMMQAMWGFLTVVLEVPSNTFAVGDSTISQTLTNTGDQLQTLRKEHKAATAQIAQLESTIIEKQNEISTREAAYRSVINEMSSLNLNHQGNIIAGFKLDIEKRQQEVKKLQGSLHMFQLGARVSQQNLRNLIARGESIAYYSRTLRIKEVLLRVNPYRSFAHLFDITQPGLLKEVTISLNDYIKGNLPKGIIPLNFNDKAKRAKEKLDKFAKASFDLDAELHQPSSTRTRVKISKSHTVNMKLESLLKLDETLQFIDELVQEKQAELSQSHRDLNCKLLALDTDKIKELLQQKDDMAETISSKNLNKLSIDWDINGLDEQYKSLQKMAAWHLSPKQFNRALNGVLGIVATFEVYNFYTIMRDPDALTRHKVSAVLDMLDIMLNIGVNIVERRAGLPTIKQSHNVIRALFVPKTAMKQRFLFMSQLTAKVALFTAANILTLVASGVSAYCAYVDLREAANRGDNELAIANGIMMSGFISMTGSAGLVLGALATKALQIALVTTLIGTLAIVGLVIILIGAVVYYLFSEEAAESWLQACPWGRNAFKNDSQNSSSARASLWQDKPELAILDLYNALYAPQVTINANQYGQYISIQLVAPLASTIEGIDFKLAWRKRNTREEHDEFKQLTVVQLAQLGALWRSIRPRLGWYMTVTFEALRRLLKLKTDDAIELQAEVTSFPQGKGATVTDDSPYLFALPIHIEKSRSDVKVEREDKVESEVEREVSHTYGFTTVLYIDFEPPEESSDPLY